MQHLHLLQHVIDYIDEHIKEDLDPEALAKLVGYSPFHFSRVFQMYIGYTPYGLRGKKETPVCLTRFD